MTLKFAKVNPSSDAMIPSKRDEDAGYDIYPCFEDHYKKIPAHHTRLIPTGIVSVLPPNSYFQLEERGSTGSSGIKRSAGVIDSGYRGEWFIAITNANDKDLYIAKENIRKDLECAAELLDVDIIIYPYEKAIVQAILHEVHPYRVEECTFEEVQNTTSERGTGKLGSTN